MEPLRAPLLALMALSMAAAGCGAAGSPPAGSDAPARVRVAVEPHLTSAPFYIAEEEGFFRAQGVEVEVVSFPSIREALAPLARGDVDVLLGGRLTSYLGAIARGAEIRMVADRGYLAADGCTFMALVTRPELLSEGELLPPPGGGRWSFSVRRGGHLEFAAFRALARAGIGPDAFEIHHLPRHAEIQALVQRRLDLTVASGFNLHKLLASGQVAIWRTGQEVVPDGQFSVILFGARLLGPEVESGERFVTAYLQGARQYLEGKTERNLELLLRRGRWSREEVESSCWIATREDGRIHLESMMELQRWALERGYLGRELAVEEIWDPRFIEAAARRLDAAEGGAGARHHDGTGLSSSNSNSSSNDGFEEGRDGGNSE